MPRVKSCCCGCSLRTGTLILLIFTLIGEISYPFKCFSAPGGPVASIIIAILSITALSVSAAGIYAVQMEKPDWLIPYMVLQLVSVASLIIIMLAMVIFGQGFLNQMLKYATTNGFAEDVKKAGFSGIILLEITCAMFAGLSYYFYVVVLSYYRERRSSYEAI